MPDPATRRRRTGNSCSAFPLDPVRAGRFDQPVQPSPDLAARFDALSPWVTRVHHAGRTYGGTYDPHDDVRMLRFLEAVRPGSLGPDDAVLECGCLEGGHTVPLARALAPARIVATDVRADNLRRAALHVELAGVDNVRFVQEDLEEPAAVFPGTYAAVFCIGLLYHLRDPARFLERCAASSPRLWLWTVVCAEDEATVLEGAHRGRFYDEPTAHQLSSTRPQSFFPTLGTLAGMLWDAGYATVELHEREMTSNGNGPAVLLEARR